MGKYNKFLVALLGVAAQVANLEILHGNAQHYLVGGIAVLTALGVHATPNTSNSAPTDPAVEINP